MQHQPHIQLYTAKTHGTCIYRRTAERHTAARGTMHARRHCQRRYCVTASTAFAAADAAGARGSPEAVPTRSLHQVYAPPPLQSPANQSRREGTARCTLSACQS